MKKVVGDEVWEKEFSSDGRGRVGVHRFTYAPGRPVKLFVDLQWVNAGNMRNAVVEFANALGAGPCGLLGREAELDAAPLGAVHLLLSFFHLVFPLLLPPP